jgi:hypothetical protein
LYALEQRVIISLSTSTLLVFRRFYKIAKRDNSFVIPVRPSVWNNSTLHGCSWNVIRWVFCENLSIIFKFQWILTRITGSLHQDLRIFLVTSRLIFLRIRTVSWKKNCSENRNTYFMLITFFRKSFL